MPNYPSRIHLTPSKFINNVDDILPPRLLTNKENEVATRKAGSEVDNFSKSGTKYSELDVGNWQRMYNQTYCSTIYDPIHDFGPQNDDVPLIDAKTVKPKRNCRLIVLYCLLVILILLGSAILIYTVFSQQISENITVKLLGHGDKPCLADNTEDKDALIFLC